MPWRETDPVDQRMRFVADYMRQAELGRVNMSALCQAYEISRPTGYKWLNRYEEAGPGALEDRPSIPGHCPHATPQSVVELVVAVRKKHPTWGPRKLKPLLEEEHPGVDIPAASTIGDILDRQGLVKRRKRRRRATPVGPRIAEPEAPNEVWAADFKGHFKLKNGKYCYPLTISDTYSRCLLGCVALEKPRLDLVRPVFEAVFSEHGLPIALRTDNGPPFASTGVLGLTQLSAWWLKLGIQLQRIEPGRPEQNGRHERLHRTLAGEACRPPRWSMKSQQRVFDDFRAEYNELRPHEALGQVPPLRVHRLSSRQYPDSEPEITYPSHYEVRKVRSEGSIKFDGEIYQITRALRLERVGLFETQAGLWTVEYGPVELGQLREQDKKFYPLTGRWRRRRRPTNN